MSPAMNFANAIKRSRDRCSHLPLGDLADPGTAPLGLASIRDRRAQASQLLASALPELDALAEHATHHGCVVVLSDASGMILEEIGSPDFLPRAERVALSPGFDWSEGRRGTNAIGTTLIDGEPVLVLGPEHHLPQNAALGCAAAPIFTGVGRIVGALDVSGDAACVDGHALGLVRMAAQQIEHRLMLAESRALHRGHLLRFHALRGLVGTSREALLTVEQGRVVAANRVALALLRQRWPQVLGARVESLFGRAWADVEAGREAVLQPEGIEPLVVQVERRTTPSRSPRPVAASAIEPDALRPLLASATRVLDQGVPVLVTGETGSGKEVFARRLHAASRRRHGPFVAVNCAALPETLIEAELFGYEEGAFTGARRKGSPGRLREAHGGILFLDEIADMPLALQPRLLRVLDERRVTPLGGGRPVAVDFDLVCATHGDLHRLADIGQFRSDLLYRVAGYGVRMPALREREDRQDLVARLFAQLGGTARRLALEDAALETLVAQPWPGNVRQLASVLRTLAALAEDGQAVTAADVERQLGLSSPARDPKAESGDEAPRPLAELERHAIDAALQACGQRVAEAARRLGVHRSTVYRHLAAARSRAH